nr:relaxin-like protein SQ10 isoform X2 [Pongo abelii]
MPRLFLFHLLGVCLLLNQFSRAVADSWMDEVIKVCGRELVRVQIAICGMSTLDKRSLSQEDAPPTPRPVAGESSRPLPIGYSRAAVQLEPRPARPTRDLIGCHRSAPTQPRLVPKVWAFPLPGDFIQTVSLGISSDGGKALRTGSCFTPEFLGALSKLCHPSSTKIQKP